MLKVGSRIHALHKADIEREIPVLIIDGAAESTCPFWICLPDNAHVRASVSVINVFAVAWFQTMRCSFISFFIAVSTYTCHSPERANRLAYSYNLVLSKKV